MTQAQLGILIGGIIPALLFGTAGVFQKVSSQQNIASGIFLASVGVGAFFTGLAVMIQQGTFDIQWKQCWPALSMGLTWGIGTMLVVYAISHYQMPIAKLAPLYNMNTLVTVLVALVIFNEWKDVNTVKLIIGSILIIGGGILVSS